ncbi:hypothetical protein BC832DRAFT_100134 [Gaertneriomyces semiglobifer]|nr:hypothetical protein BC832DRAFT_100134 [Gaertneriomyces semiglobifer]
MPFVPNRALSRHTVPEPYPPPFGCPHPSNSSHSARSRPTTCDSQTDSHPPSSLLSSCSLPAPPPHRVHSHGAPNRYSILTHSPPQSPHSAPSPASSVDPLQLVPSHVAPQSPVPHRHCSLPTLPYPVPPSSRRLFPHFELRGPTDSGGPKSGVTWVSAFPCPCFCDGASAMRKRRNGSWMSGRDRYPMLHRVALKAASSH